MSNRITAAIARADERIKAKVASGEVSKEKLAELDRNMDMDLNEYVRFQNLKSSKFLEGKLSQEEAMTIYGFLGNTVQHFNRQTLAVKTTLTQLFSELLAQQIKARRMGR